MRISRIQPNRPLETILTEAGLRREQLIMPLIIYERKKINQNEMIPAAVPNCESELFRLVYNCLDVGIRSFILFGVPTTRDSKGTGASNSQGIVQR